MGINTVSPHCQMEMEFRFNCYKEQERIVNEVERITNTSYIKGTKSYAHGLVQRSVMEETKEQLDLISLIESITKEKILIEHRGGVSDANIVASCGTTTLDGFGPFGDNDHTLNERALKSSFEQRIDMVTKILNYFQKNIEKGIIYDYEI